MYRLILFLLTFYAATSQAGDPLLGKDIFQKGHSLEAASATIGEGMEMNVKSFPCASCHKLDASGGFEGGVRVPAITWRALTKRRPDETHTAYTEESLKAAITEGIGSLGQELHPLMPRYQFSQIDLDNLLAYLKVQTNFKETGINKEAIKIGVIVTELDQYKDILDTSLKVISNYFGDINLNGGINGREIQLVKESPKNIASDVLFHTILIATPEEIETSGLYQATVEQGVPILFSLVSLAKTHSNIIQHQASLFEQLSSLVAYRGSTKDSRHSVLFIDDNELGEKISSKLAHLEGVDFDIYKVGSAVQDISTNHLLDDIFWFSRKADITNLITYLNASSGQYNIYTSLDLIGAELKDLSLNTNVKIILSNPRGAPDFNSQAYRNYEKFCAIYGVSNIYPEWVRMSYLSAELISYTLKKSGRHLNREKLLNSARSINSLRVGVAQSISTNENGYKPSQILLYDSNNKSLIQLHQWLSGQLSAN